MLFGARDHLARPGAEVRAFESVVVALERFGALVAVRRPGWAALATRGPARYFGGEESFAVDVAETVAALGESPRARRRAHDPLTSVRPSSATGGGSGSPMDRSRRRWPHNKAASFPGAGPGRSSRRSTSSTSGVPNFPISSGVSGSRPSAASPRSRGSTSSPASAPTGRGSTSSYAGLDGRSLDVRPASARSRRRDAPRAPRRRRRHGGLRRQEPRREALRPALRRGARLQLLGDRGRDVDGEPARAPLGARRGVDSGVRRRAAPLAARSVACRPRPFRERGRDERGGRESRASDSCRPTSSPTPAANSSCGGVRGPTTNGSPGCSPGSRDCSGPRRSSGPCSSAAGDRPSGSVSSRSAIPCPPRPDDAALPWPGQLPCPNPTVVPQEPYPAEVLDGDGRHVGVDGRGTPSGVPASVAVGGRPPSSVVAWAGPWPIDEQWWDTAAHRRRARIQVVTADGDGYLLAVDRGRWVVEGSYD